MKSYQQDMRMKPSYLIFKQFIINYELQNLFYILHYKFQYNNFKKPLRVYNIKYYKITNPQYINFEFKKYSLQQTLQINNISSISPMSRAKRTKNIFNQNIVDQSLFHNQEMGQYQISGLQIKSDWLRDAPVPQYIKNIYSSLKLAELRQQLFKLKDQASLQIKQNNGQLSSPVKANLFKIAVLKKKIQGFQIDNTGDYNKISTTISSHSTFSMCKIPNTQKMLVQKLSGGPISFFNKCIVRKCFLHQKTLVVQSKKNQEKKQQWIKLDLEQFHLEVNRRPLLGQTGSKQKIQLKTNNKSNSNNKVPEGFQGFQWVDGYDVRLLLIRKQQRPYCVYLPQQQVQNLFKYLKFHNFQQNLHKNKGNVFNQLTNQLFQKVITLFGNKLRMYDHNMKVKNNQRNISFDSPLKKQYMSNDLNDVKEVTLNDNNKSPQFSHHKRANNDLQQYEQQDLQNYIPGSIKKKKSQSNIKNENLSQILFSPQQRKQSISHYGNISNFKLRTKKATVFYDELQGDVNIQQIQQQRKSSKIFDSPMFSGMKENISPQFKISDINLNLKQQGMSQIDQDQSSPSIVHNRKRTTSISVSGNFFHLMSQKQAKGDIDPQNKFNINIHEIQSDDQNDKYNHSQSSSKNSSPYQSMSHFDPSFNNIFNNGSDPLLPRQSTGSMSSLQLQQIQQMNQLERHYSQPNQISPRSYRTSSSGFSHGIPTRLCLRQRVPNMKATCYGIQMLYPYHKQNMKFSILQIDHQIQMQKYKVICNSCQFNFKQKQNSKPRYSYYHQQQNKNTIFGLNRQSNHFIFILKQQTKPDYFFYFQINMNDIRYQRDQSQLILLRQEDEVNFFRSTNKSPKNLVSPRSFSKKNNYGFNNTHSVSSVNNPSSSKNFKFAAILHLYVSVNQIQIWPQLSTVQFIKKYILMTIYDNHYDFKHNFIDKKKKYHEIKNQINKICLKNIIKSSSFKQVENFKQLIFNGLCNQLIALMQGKLLKQQNLNKQQIWQKISFTSHLNVQQLKLLQQSFIPPSLRNIRMIVKPLQILSILTNFKNYNKNFKERLYQICLYFLYTQSIYTAMIQNIITALAKQILTKLENILLGLKTEDQIKSTLKVYLDVEYEIDSLFGEIKKYFI